LQLSQEIFKQPLTVPLKSSDDISAEPARGQKVEEHVVTDLHLRNQGRPCAYATDAAALGPLPWCLGRLFTFARYTLCLRIQ